VDERWETTSAVVMNVLYAVAVVVMVIASVPSLRNWLAAVGERQRYAWRYGRWLASRVPEPNWTHQLQRDDLPQERPT
jgi:hypothetical protein